MERETQHHNGEHVGLAANHTLTDSRRHVNTTCEWDIPASHASKFQGNSLLTLGGAVRSSYTEEKSSRRLICIQNVEMIRNLMTSIL